MQLSLLTLQKNFQMSNRNTGEDMEWNHRGTQDNKNTAYSEK